MGYSLQVVCRGTQLFLPSFRLALVGCTAQKQCGPREKEADSAEVDGLQN